MRRKTTHELLISMADDRLVKVRLPIGIAWVAARGIARDTHASVCLAGQFGLAAFGSDGCGDVYWNDRSTCPGEVTHFGERTIVCI